jgi:hypothetical protein
LREAINAANAAPGNDEIVFDLGQTATITLVGSTLPTITDASGLTIDGGQSASVKISGNGQVRVFEVVVGAQLALKKLTVADGSSFNTFTSSSSGGGLLNNGGTEKVVFSTFSKNSVSSGLGGGIFNNNSTLTVTNSTFLENSAYVGGGIYNGSGSATLRNTIMANGQVLKFL